MSHQPMPGPLLGVRGSLMLGDTVGGDVPTAIIAGRSLIVTGIAVERTAVEKLLEPGLVFGRQLAGLTRQRKFVATTLAVAAIQLVQQRGIVVVHAARDETLAITQRTGHSELSSNRFTDEGTLVGKLIQKL